MKANNIEEFFGTLLYSEVEVHKSHLKTSKYNAHNIMDSFYGNILFMVDDLIEAYQGIHGKVEEYKNILTTTGGDAVKYLEALRDIVRVGREDYCKESELQSLCDDILRLIDSTLYKLKELKESKNGRLVNYLIESIE